MNEAQKAKLISNGTYNADETVNLQTAKEQGWDKVWEEQQKPNSAKTPSLQQQQ